MPKKILFIEDESSLQKTFGDIGETENEFLLSLKVSYDEILNSKSLKLGERVMPVGGLYYEKRIANHQKTLDELFDYAALKWSGSKASA